MNHRILLLVPLAFSACYAYSAPPDTDADDRRRATTYAEDKQKMVLEMERRMNELTRHYQAQIVGIQDRLHAGLAALDPPVRLGAIERTLSGYNASSIERYEAAIDRLLNEAVTATEELVGREATPGVPRLEGTIERDALRIAAEVGGRASGAGYGFVSGIAEVDERAMVTIELLQGIANIGDLRAAGALRKGEMLQCSAQFRHDVTESDLLLGASALASRVAPAENGKPTRVGRINLFQSDVLDSHRFAEQETMAQVVTFENERLNSTDGFELVQLVRYRVIRGGMIVDDFGWQLDPTTPNRDGVLPLRQDLVDPRFIASEPFFPAINIDHSQFDRLRDFTLVFDYKTLVVDRQTATAIGGVDWQLQWNVSMTRQVRFIHGVAPNFDAFAHAVLASVKSGTARDDRPDFALARPEPAPRDLLATRVSPIEPANPLLERELAPGVVGKIGIAVGGDVLRIPAAGRAWIVANRMNLLLADARFMTYLDGRLGRYVLAIINIAPDSGLSDLGFRDGDAIVHVNDVPIEDFADLYSYLAEHPSEAQYEVGMLRDTANRRLVFSVDLEGAVNDATLASDVTEEMAERFNRLQEDLAGSKQSP